MGSYACRLVGVGSTPTIPVNDVMAVLVKFG